MCAHNLIRRVLLALTRLLSPRSQTALPAMSPPAAVRAGALTLSRFLGAAAQPGSAFAPAAARFATVGGVAAYSLPELPYSYGALEPVISGEIMELHHARHHAAYVTNLNKALEEYAEAEAKGNLAKMIALQPAINFNGGGALRPGLAAQGHIVAAVANAYIAAADT